MKAVQVNSHGKPTEVTSFTETEDPNVSNGQVIIDLVASPINPSDMLFIKGLYPRKGEFPLIGGNDGISPLSAQIRYGRQTVPGRCLAHVVGVPVPVLQAIEEPVGILLFAGICLDTMKVLVLP